MSKSVSVPALKQYLQAAQSLNVSIEELLLGTPVSVELLDDNTQRIPIEIFEQVLARLVGLAPTANLGLVASRFVNTSTYASLGLISMSAKRLKDSIDLVPTYETLVGDMGTTELVDIDTGFALRWHCQLSDSLVKQLVIETVLSSWYRYGKEFVGLAGKLMGVQFQHQLTEDRVDAYQQMFGCNVYMGNQYNALLLPTELLEQQLPQANPGLQASLIEHADHLLQSLNQQGSFTEQVMAIVEQLLTQAVSKPLVAQHLGVSSRTLQRQLKAEDYSFQQVLDEVRIKRAKQMIKQGADMTEIADNLGFSETRSFFRRFKQCTGKTVGQYKLSLS